jgi:hypothetical protein
MPQVYKFHIKFDNEPPFRITVKSWEEFRDTLERLMRERGGFYEWIIRDYDR